MSLNESKNANNFLALIVIASFILALIAAGVTFWQRKQQPETPPDTQPAAVTIEKPNIIEYREDAETNENRELTEQRKASLGIDTGVDLIVKADESLKIGDAVVPMKEVLDRIKLKRGEVIESDLDSSGLADAIFSNGDVKDIYGIYVVKPDDNIWNIHFHFLKDYFEKRGVVLSPNSDETTSDGFSTGVGKILKFSENMVYIYNIREKKLDIDLNLIHPLTKIVVFDMGKVFALLEQISYGEVNQIQFDGETLWIPTKQ